MNIWQGLRTKREEALEKAKDLIAKQQALVKQLWNADALDKERLRAEIANVREDWQQQIKKVRVLHQMIVDYGKDGWGSDNEIVVR